MLQELINIATEPLIKLSVAALIWAGIFLGKKIYGLLKKYIDEKLLDKFIDELTKAAEQTLKKEDDDGSKRLGYVQDMLIQAGIELTDAIMAKIESSVFKINKAN